jgi:ankyrin repeat protein
MMGEEQTVRQLLATDFVRQDLRDKNGATAFHVAIKRGNWNVAKEFLESNADVNVTDSDGNTPLILAINLRNEDLTRLLLSSTRVDPNAPDADLAMPLHIAIRSSQDHVAKMLLRCTNIVVNWRDKAGKTPLWDALSRGNNAIARMLIGRSDIDLHLRDYSEQLPPLSTVNKDIVDRLEELDENKWTPSDAAFGLVWPACEADLTPWTKYANSVDISGNSLLCWAVMHRWVEAAKALLSCDLVDINTPNYEGMSPLMLTLETGQAELARLLLGRADVEIYRLDLGGRDMLSYAVTEDMRAVLSSAEMRAMRTSALGPRQNEEPGTEVAAAVPDSPRGDGAAVELVAEVPPWPGRRVHGGREAGRDERRGRRNGLFGRLANLGWRSARR